MADFIPAVTALTGGEPQLLMLDLDGTLIDSVPGLAVAIDSMLVAMQRAPVGADQVSHWVGNGADMLIRRALCLGNEEQAGALAVADVIPARALFDQAYLAVLTRGTGNKSDHVFPGVENFLRARTCPKVLITNKPRLFTLPLLRALGWESLFSKILCGDDLPQKKPEPGPLLHACQWHRVDPAHTLMVGDSLTDIRAARAAGVASVAVTYGYNHGEDITLSEPDLLVNSLEELLTYAN